MLQDFYSYTSGYSYFAIRCQSRTKNFPPRQKLLHLFAKCTYFLTPNIINLLTLFFLSLYFLIFVFLFPTKNASKRMAYRWLETRVIYPELQMKVLWIGIRWETSVMRKDGAWLYWIIWRNTTAARFRIRSVILSVYFYHFKMDDTILNWLATAANFWFGKPVPLVTVGFRGICLDPGIRISFLDVLKKCLPIVSRSIFTFSPSPSWKNFWFCHWIHTNI